MSPYIGAIVLIAAMSYALWALFNGMRTKSYSYFGKQITWGESPVAFCFVMAALIVCLLLGARTLPYFLVALS